jgi:hypothetical protein
MTQTTGIVRGGLVINKIFLNYNQSVKNVDQDTKYTTLVKGKYVN